MAELSETIVIDVPYSTALDAIERRLKAVNNKIALTVPLSALGLPAPLSLEAPVTVDFVAVHGEKGQLERYDRLHLQWEPAFASPFPTFNGEIALRPLGLQTELALNGTYEPPLGLVGAAFDAMVGNKIAIATVTVLLGDIKAHLESDFATVRDTIEQTPPHG